MPRRKISEFRSKSIVNESLNLPYKGWSIVVDDKGLVDLKNIGKSEQYVVKVDQAVKGRFKKGLVILDVVKADISATLQGLVEKGYHSFLVEPYIHHTDTVERYLSLTQTREGIIMAYSQHGGVDIESKAETVQTQRIDETTDWKLLAKDTQLSVETLKNIISVFVKNYIVLLEINPYIIVDETPLFLDCAIEVDDAGAYFTTAWSEADIRTEKSTRLTNEEVAVRNLDANSPASFNLSVLNKDGSIFLLLSGGGASVVIADEVYNQGYGKLLANYGEYSGNPTGDEAYLYTSEVFKLLLASKAKQKVIFIGGAVANFTDIANTFTGIIQAIDEYAEYLIKHKVKIYVRRGGPRQEIGLAKMRTVLEAHGLMGGVYDPSTTITEALGVALKGLKYD